MQITSAAATSTSTAQETQSLIATMAALYSTKVGGNSYSGEVQLSNGSYVATVSGLPGISGSGGTVLEAENALNQRISVVA